MEGLNGSADLPPVIAPPSGLEPSPPFLPPAGRAGPRNPWLSIWVRPRATMRHILDGDPRRRVVLLMLLSGACDALRSRSPEMAEELPLSVLVAVKIAGGALAGLVVLYLGGFLLRVTGRWLEGRGDGVALRAALAWSNVTSIGAFLLWLPLLAVFGGGAFTLDPADLQGDLPALAFVMLIGFLLAATGGWGFIVCLKCVAEAHRFSAWRALGAVILSVLLALAPLAVPVLLAVGTGLDLYGVAS